MRIRRGVPKQHNTVRLDLLPEGCGDWIEVKKVLSSGERGDILDYSIRSVSQPKAGSDGETKLDIDYGKQKFAMAAAYLLNWNFVDADEAPITFINGNFEQKLTQVRALDDATVDAINQALERHEASLGNGQPSGSTDAPAGEPTSPSRT